MSAAVGTSGDADHDSFSSDSDDEFLLMQQSKGGAGGSADREALVRKKLLESFYGTSAVNDRDQRLPETGRDITDDEDEDDDDDEDDGISPTGLSTRVIPGQTEDLDSPNFDANAHTQKHVFSSSIHPLLETEESLACQVRTLDSTLQTLVYENYSRFIDATEAIRNIDVSVRAHHQNLQSLEQNISSAAEISRSMEATVGPLRDQIVEKLRVRRLLQRLDTLLKLPSTLRQQIQRGKYRWAAQSYLSAYSILSKHSQGFESLQRIESECRDIIQTLLLQVRRKLIHWSGGLLAMEDEEDASVSKQEDDPLDGESLPDPPQSVADIIECAATPPLMLSQDPPLFNTRVSREDCQEMALTATLRLLERHLDAHHIEVQSLQKQQKSTPMAPNPLGTLGEPALLTGEDGSPVPPTGVPVNSGHHLIPTQVLDSILEACTLYSLSFVAGNESNLDQGDESKPITHDERLAQFISTAFNSFLQHVRGEFLDLIMWHQQQQAKKARAREASPSASVDAPAITPGDDDDSSDIAYEQISAAMSTLVVSVRQLASGLSLPEVLVSADFASGLVDQTIGLTEAMVRRQVDQKFYSLRMRVVQDCLTPFCHKVVVSPSDVEAVEHPRLLESVQLASVALSDSLQLVDDTVRSMLVTTTPDETELDENVSLSGAEKDDTMLTEAVHLSTKRFATWLASALELLAGCESSDPRMMLQVPKLTATGTAETPGASFRNGDLQAGESGLLSEGTSNDRTKVETALRDLHNSTEPTLNMTLALAEMCRVAERIVAENINQLIGVHGGAAGGKQRKVSATKGGLFSEDGKNDAANNPISDRFRLAASRVLNLYASTRGTEAAALLCQDLGTSDTQQGELTGPSPAVCKTLEIAKSICRDCADLFGGDLSAGPVPNSLDDEYASLTAMARRGANRQGLVLDVERMFLEKVAVFPHPNDFQEFRQTTVLSVFFRVAFKALAEYTRFVQLSLQGYHQLVVDTEFLKWFLPHYIKDEVLRDGTNAHSSLESLLLEAAQTGRSRCLETNRVEEEVTERNRARATIRHYMDENDAETLPFVI
eukprot:Nitzschia sp. Nitz4//scaffold85_size83877//79620//82799//NITZ4_005244-RA/size83877-processed-gene-0.145-mRNA-1//-1//CDS//3329559182//4773//frame0